MTERDAALSAETKRVACKYYISGCCKMGSDCAYAHDFSAPSSQLCTHYVRGRCAYGSGCRYVHDKSSRTKKEDIRIKETKSLHLRCVPSLAKDTRTSSNEVSKSNVDDGDQPSASTAPRAWRKDKVACAMQASGRCSRGSRCPFSHEEEDLSKLMSILGRNLKRTEPSDDEGSIVDATTEEGEEGTSESKNEDAKFSCGICLEVPKDGRYGLLNCNHSFCLSCIRGWRATRSKEEDQDGKAMARACPMCRVETHLIVPSFGWPADESKKKDIENRYKAKLASTDCIHFNLGEGQCPFGTSCLYRHRYQDGSLDDRKPRARLDADGAVEVVAPVKLSSFLGP